MSSVVFGHPVHKHQNSQSLISLRSSGMCRSHRKNYKIIQHVVRCSRARSSYMQSVDIAYARVQLQVAEVVAGAAEDASKGTKGRRCP